MRRSGFTLIELLVVIAIIAILAAILFPVFARAREKARQSSCLSNEKQLMLAVMSYSQDYDELLVSTVYDANASAAQDAGDYTWRTAVLPYAKNAQIFQCTSKRMTTTFNGGMDLSFTSGYALNVVHWAANNPAPPPGQSIGSVEYPSACVFMTDFDGAEAFANDGTNVHLGAGGTDWKTAATGGHYRHNGGCNAGFVDGHVKWYKPEAMKCVVGDCWFSISGT